MKVNMIDKLKNTLERNEGILADLESGMKASDVAKKYGVSPGTPPSIRENYDELKVMHETQLQYYLDIIELFEENGKTVTEIADMMGTTKQNVSRILKVCEVSRDSGGRSKEKTEILEALRVASEKVAEIEFDVMSYVNTKKLVEFVKAEGLTLESFADAHEIKVVKVRNLAKANGFKLLSNNDVDGILLRSHVIHLRDVMKYTQVEIAEELNISQAYVSKILLDAGLRVRMPKDVYEVRDAQILEDHAKGMDVKELMIKYDLKEVNVRRILYKEKDDVSE